MYKRRDVLEDPENDETTSSAQKLTKLSKLARRGITFTSSGFEIAVDEVTHNKRVRDALADYLLPQGFPESVAPQYATYMGWRGVQYFFGGWWFGFD